MFTLAVALLSITAVFAQNGRYSRNGSRDVVLGRGQSTVYNANDHRYDYSFTAKERDKQIKQVKKDFGKQIKSVQKDRSLRSFEKQQQVRMLEAQRDRRIEEINDRFNNLHNTQYASRNRRW